MSGRLKASFEDMRQFSTHVSHELRTPLTAIQGQLEVALFTATRKEQLQKRLKRPAGCRAIVEPRARSAAALASESGQIPTHKAVVI